MLRIHFTAADLARVRLAAGPDPLWELLLSLHMLTGNREAVWARPWRQQAAGRITAPARALSRLAPPVGYSVDFLTPAGGCRDIDEGIAAILATPASQLADDIGTLGRQQPLPPWAADLATRRPAALDGLGRALRAYYDAALAPHWAELAAQAARHRGLRADRLLSGGVEALLGALHPSVRWAAPVLHVAYPSKRDLHLDGRGLVLQPARFCWRMPVMLRRDGDPPTLVYPMEAPWELTRPGGGSAALARLLGRTRAQVLEALAGQADGCGTSHLARQLGISPASASEHAAVLRAAGLVHSQTDGRAVRHLLTDTGRDLLEPPGQDPAMRRIVHRRPVGGEWPNLPDRVASLG